jgi:hypothetical protein
MATTDVRDGITLTCSPEKQGETIVFSYSIANGGHGEAFVSDAGTKVDMAARTASADPDAVSIWLSPDKFATVLKGVAPLPEERDVPGLVMPLMVRLAPGARIERTLTLSLPLAEQSSYYSVANLRDYRLGEIEGLRLAVDVLARVPAGFVAKPVAYAPAHVDIGVRGTLPLLTRLSCRFPARGLHMMVRTGAFPRPD